MTEENELHPFLKTFPVSLQYDFSERKGTLIVEEGTCTDTLGCIGVFMAIDANVREINIYSGLALDTSYKLSNSGTWLVFRGLTPVELMRLPVNIKADIKVTPRD